MMPFLDLPAASRPAGSSSPWSGPSLRTIWGQRILDQFEDLAVELGLGADHFELDILAQLVAEIAHDPRQFLPGIADRLHARLHDAFLQFGRHIGQPLQRHLEF